MRTIFWMLASGIPEPSNVSVSVIMSSMKTEIFICSTSMLLPEFVIAGCQGYHRLNLCIYWLSRLLPKRCLVAV